ncbi:MAG: BolA family transcriptional regulator [Deltaproteobacteria bacterium]|nr:BolA family transcriptional regulator [Deltaproteobacteria bacterium]
MPAPITASEIESMILTALPDARIQVRDTTGGGDHYEAIIVSPAFVGKTRVNRHRMVYGALQDAMQARIHALALITMTPEELQQEQASQIVNIQSTKTH